VKFTQIYPLARHFVIAGCILALVGCATPTAKDYSAFKSANPRSIIVLPPINKTPEINATVGFYSNTHKPIAESGFYVFPASLVYETFKGNGISIPDEIHNVELKKLQEIFGADAAMYIVIKEYGTKFQVFSSASIVTADATLIDLRTGTTLWEGTATASSAEGQDNSQAGLAGLIVRAIVSQVIGTVTDQSFQISKSTSERLLSASQPKGILYGPYHNKYRQDKR
jgi:hypothetical protein